ncbi:hypothetical protein GCM10023331_25270 [Algivirga pacifica]|uniref:Adhesin domain-containing protein n=2 Tax=Algivirga pacifica TaxID=1162670 RepID=A0ABP9DG26_9BACT
MLLLLGVISAQAQEEQTKTFQYNHKVDKSDLLSIDNRFGNVVIATNDGKEIDIKVEVKAWASSAKKAQNILDDIEISESISGGRYLYQTTIHGGNGSNNRQGYEINYHVKMPKALALDLENKYGNISMEDYTGKLSLELGYGQLYAKKLETEECKLEIKYSKASIDYLKGGNIESKYCSSFDIQEAGNLDWEDKYGSASIGKVHQLKGESAYSKLKIGELTGVLSWETDYSSLKVDRIATSFTDIRVDSSYGGVRLNFDKDTAFDFAVTTKYGGFSTTLEGLDIMKEYEKNTSGEYEGYRNKKNTGKRVEVDSRYGSVRFSD